MRELNRIIVHCTATKAEWLSGQPLAVKIAEIRRWHTDPPSKGGRGWSDIGYHFLIDRDGKIGRGRAVEKIGAHVRGHNKDSIGIALIGGHGAGADDSPEDHFTDQQLAALRGLIEDLKGKYGDLRVVGHNRYANKGCPGFRAAKWYARPPNVGVPGSGAIGGVISTFYLDGWPQYVMIGAVVVFGAVALLRWKESKR